MNRFVRNLIWLSLPAFFVIVGLTSAKAQVFDPNDGITTYNRNNPPAEPAFGQVGKWVRTRRVSWNTDSYKAYIYKGIAFRLKWPKNYDATGQTKYPLFLFFHGKGERGSIYDNEYQLYHGGELHKNAVDNGDFNGFLLYPQTSDADGNWTGQQRQYMMELINNFLVPQTNVNPLRITVDGLSAGGLSSWRFFESYPKLVAGCLPISNASSAYNSIIVNNKFTPIWLFQGALDQSPSPSSSRYLQGVADNAGANFRYTEYPNLGHGCWYSAWGEPDYFPFLTRAHKANPWPLNGRTQFCNTGPGSISTTIGVTAGFSAYQWRKNDEILNPNGTTANTLTVTDIGTYSCRIRIGPSSEWSEWSPIPVVIAYETEATPPDIKVSGLSSRVLPAPDGKTTVALEVPAGYSEYNWQKVGDPPNAPPLSTNNKVNGATVGQYKVQVKEQFGCTSMFTDPFTVIDANGPNKPDAASGLIAIPLSFTSIKLNWSANPNPVYPQTHFEIYQATRSGGPYQFVSLVNGDIFSFIKEGLTPGVKYYYIVRAVNNTAAAPVSNEATAATQKDVNPPTAPGNLQITGTTRNAVSLTWEESTDDVGMDYYEIYVNGVKSYVTSDIEYTIYGLEFGKTYNFSIEAVDIAGNKSAPSNQVTAQPLAKGLTFKHYTGTWDFLPDFNLLSPISTGTVPNVTLGNASQSENYGFLWEGFIHIPQNGYYVFSTTSDDGSKLYLDTDFNHRTSPYNHTATPAVSNDGLHGTKTVESSRINLNEGVYPIAITFFQQGGGAEMSIAWKRVNQNGSTTYWSGAIPDSAFVDAPAPPAGTAPAKPTDLTATAISYKRINLSWTDNSNNEKSFELYRSTDPLDHFNTIGIVPANTTGFADTLLEPATTYYYKIRAINQFGESDFDKVGPGVNYAYYETPNNLQYLPNFNNMTPVKTGRVAGFGLGMQMRENYFALKFDGFINITQAGDYTFYLQSDDGSQLYIDDQLVVDHDGAHGSTEKPGNPIYLSIGAHAIRVTYFEIGGNEALIARYQGPGIAKQEIPGNVLGDVLANATTLAAPPAPAAPGALTAVGISRSAIRIQWENHASDATGIELYRSYEDNADYLLVTELPPNTTLYEDKELYPSSLFYYKVRAIGEGGSSDYSNEKDARTLSVVPVVTPIEDIYIRYGSTVILPVEATSGSPVVINLQVTDLPAFATFSQTGNGQGLITFTPTVSDAGTYKITITATNPQGDFTGRQFNLVVNDNYVPSINPVSDISVPAGGTGQVSLSATDNDVADQLIWSYAGLPGFTSAAASNQTAVLTFQPQNKDVGEYHIKVIVSDGKNGKDTTSFTLSVTGGSAPDPNDGTIPLNPKNATGVFVNELNGVKLTWTNAAYNAQKNEIYRSFSISGGYTLLDTAGSTETSYVDYTVTGNTKTYYLVRAVNVNGGSNSVIIKVDVPNKAPVIAAEDAVMKGGSVADLTVSATDDPGNIISLNISGLPSFAKFTDNGNGQGVIHLTPTGTHIGNYNFTVKATDNYGAVSSKTVKITVTDKYISSVYINFNNKDYPVSFEPWNSFNAAQTGSTAVVKNTKVSDLKKETGEATTISVELLEPWPQHYGGVVTGNNSGIYPDSIMMSGYYFYTQASAPQKTIRISGLSGSKKYNLIFFGSRAYASAQKTYFTVGDQTVLLDATGNSSTTVELDALQPVNGVIDVIVKADVNKYAVINAMVIQEFDDAIVLPPYNFVMSKSTKNSITLSWKSSAANVTGFEIWRSDTPEGTYSKLPAVIPGNVFNYTDEGLAASTIYYYKIRAVSGSSYSDYSDYASGATIQYSVNINFNDGIGQEPLPWNNTDLLYNGYKLSNMVDDKNQYTGINLTVVDNFSGFNNWGKTTGNNSGFVSDNVMQEFYYVQYGETTRLMIDGLNLGYHYNFVFYGNCDNRALGSLVGLYTINGVTVQLDAKNNIQNTVQINDVSPDAFGRVHISIEAQSFGYGFVNSISIQAIPMTSNAGQQGSMREAGTSVGQMVASNYPEAAKTEGKIDITAYPVPVDNEIVLRFSLDKPADKLNVSILDNNGRPVYSQELRDLRSGRNDRKLNFNGNKLVSGIYFIRVSGWRDGNLRVVKIIK
ncbi:MAG: fibronectin type III domain-containing protein [Chitinophagaceae bacterium]|nr:fibronectin type III domain-containing protein [Chitinophagaceae bacterium]